MIHAQEDRSAALAKAEAVVRKLEEGRLHQAARIVRDGVAETLSYMALPAEHWHAWDQQHAGANHAWDSWPHPRRGELPRWVNGH